VKSKKILILSVVCILLFSSFVGCTEDNGDGNDGDGNGDTTASNWYAYNFDANVKAEGDNEGKLKEFSFRQTYNENGSVMKFDVTSTNLGKKTVDIKVIKMTMEGWNYTETTEEVSIEAYEVNHRVEVLQDDSGDDHPDWVELNVFLPTDDYSTAQYFWIYAMTEYTDSDGNEGMWSYYLTEEMQSSGAMYIPYTEGDLNNYDSWILYGLYGWAWTWFQPFTDTLDLEEGSVSVPIGGGSFSYSITKTTESVGDYDFEAYNVKSNAVDFEGGASLEGTFAPTLPVPIYVKVGGSGSDYYSYYEIELTDVVLE